MAQMRHWKQHFHADADFVWRKRKNVGPGEWSKFGDPVDKSKMKRGKLKLLWELGWIELANWSPPQIAIRTGPIVEARGQGWFVVTTPEGVHKVRGQEAVDQLLASLKAKRAA